MIASAGLIRLEDVPNFYEQDQISCSRKLGTPSQPDQSCSGISGKSLSLINPAQANQANYSSLINPAEANQAIRQTKEICEKSISSGIYLGQALVTSSNIFP